MKNKIEEFEIQKKRRINKIVKDKKLEKLSNQWMRSAFKYNYQYNFNWLGIPIIRLPSDIVVFQEVVYRIKPDLIIETGVAHGGSLILSASLINLLNNNGEVVGVDVDIRKHNKKRLEKHPLYKLITLYEGDSCDKKIIDKISKHVKKRKKILVVLDSNHTHSHVLNELNLYSKFISKNSYIILPDTFIEKFPKNYFSNRDWDKGNNPYTAALEFLKKNKDFAIDKSINSKTLITESFDGYIKKIK